MQKTTVLGSVGAVLMLVACATATEESGTAGAADTTATTATNGAATTGTSRTTPRTGTSRAGTTNGTAATVNADGGAAPAGPTCYAGQGSCEPTNPDACGVNETCDIDGSSGTFQCFPPPNDAHLGDACNNSQGPFCAQGLACDNGTCKTYCCDDSQCAAGTTCQQTGTVGTITISVCQ